MATRISPEQYIQRLQPKIEQPTVITQKQYVLVPVIPEWVPILLGIAMVGAFAIALYAIAKVD